MASAVDFALNTRGNRAVHRFEPLNDARWDEFLARHSRASLFHSTPWLKALNQTYDYPVVGYTTCEPGEELKNALVFCRVESWLTGRRLVSLPFSDHCEPLVDRGEDLQALLNAVGEEAKREKWRYVEVRPLTPLAVSASLHAAKTEYSFHELDLQSSLEAIFSNLHKDSIQRKIRRAEREGLRCDEGPAETLLNDFYHLLEITRRRHHLPPQPKKWFQNLLSCFGDSLRIRVARRNDQPLAAILTLCHKNTLTYKYGASDAAYNSLGGVQLVHWSAIRDAKAAGLQVYDLGRSDVEQSGLITFKDRWGAKQSTLTYSRFALTEDLRRKFADSKAKSDRARGILALLPKPVVALLGRTLYKHVG